MSQTVYIYGLYDPRNNKLRYVGKTIDLDARMWGHIASANSGEKNHKSNWIRGLLEQDLRPEMQVLEETDEENWQEAEKKWIAECLASGEDLINTLEGGDSPPDWTGRKQSSEHIKKRVRARRRSGNYSHSEETKKRISEVKRGTQAGAKNSFYGRTHSEASKRKMSKSSEGQVPWNKGVPCTEETKRKISEAKRGSKASDETRRKLSKIRKGRKLSKAHCEAISQSHIGTHLSEETKEKLRQANLGKHHSEETKEKLRKHFTGRFVSEETRKRMSESRTGMKMSGEHRQHSSEARKRQWQDPEYRAKMLAAQKRRREREKAEKEADKESQPIDILSPRW